MSYYFAQINIARMLTPIDDPIMADFVNNLDRINTLAERSPGFVWRLKDENDNAASINVFNDNFMIINMSVWKDKKSLFDFTYSLDHVEIFKRRKEWFEKMTDMHMALWYVRNGYDPTPQDAKARLNYLNQYGETPYAFSFKSEFSPEEALNYKRQT
ncbi:DUF3291 domain-containing protein [Maribacter halichondriae]|uniref:DUF3291 domain-containing protein n=1 Tax=Maribacter halichondriae TaxID=2980554 RepID=UPI002359CA12|nr:DUF3291 domain-containing protein [Maribacter sp. Hal144]